MSPLYDEVMNYGNMNRLVSGIKDIFQEIERSDEPVETYKHISKLQIPFYQAKQQYDSHECLVYLLNEIFPSLSTVDSFNLQTFESIVCDYRGCNYNSETITNKPALTLNVMQTFEDQSISEMIQRSLYRHQLPDFRCETCQSVGNCYKTNTIFKLPDILIIQLSLFSYNSAGFIEKIIPNLNIDESLSLYGKTLNLSAITYHDGPNTTSGHYTSSVKINESWFKISDNYISEGAKFSCLSTETTTPYVLIYKNISSDHVHAIENSLATMSEGTVGQNSFISTANERGNNEGGNSFISSTFETPESKMRKSMINEVNMQKNRIELIEKKKQVQRNACISKSPVKRKTKYAERRAGQKFKENEKKRKSFLRENLDESSKEKIKASDKKRKSSDTRKA